ncbi:MAG: EF-hand domain-containing protein [Campylobacterota bacterium]|nr:EF-hand domain-containing protein [Campylobacterota bacterium]
MKNLTKNLLLVSLIATLGFAVPTAKEKFTKADKNGDGVLTSQEFYNDQARKMIQKTDEGRALKGASTAPQFKNVDINKDGKVTFKEYNKFHTIRQQEMMNIRNKGQNYSKNKGRGIDTFNKYDINNDGVIDKKEFRQIYKELNKNIGQNKGKGGGYNR